MLTEVARDGGAAGGSGAEPAGGAREHFARDLEQRGATGDEPDGQVRAACVRLGE
eukprot:COSAG02_NODE_4227_length_5610_cov_4.036654_3_plen_55_part_00